MLEMLVKQVIALSWFRCLMEEGYDFINKQTGEIEKSEIVIYTNFQRGTNLFDMPSALCSPKGLEKNLLEVIGNLCVYNINPKITELLYSNEFKEKIKDHITKIKNREFSGKVK